MTRMSVNRGRASPTGVTSRCSMARSSLTWRLGETSPISSSSTVPPLASSRSPLRSCTAPVNDPLMCPKSSRSTRLGIERGQADRQEWAVAPAAVAMNRPRDQLLAGPALARDQHGHVGRRDQCDALEQLLHGRRRTDQASRFRCADGPGLGSRLCRFSRARFTTVVAWSRSNGLTR